jgi:UDP-glucose 4-epimerase
VSRVRRILITGALGHIGSALIRDELLVNNVDEIILVDDLSTQRYCSLFQLPRANKFTFLEGDIADRVTAELLTDVDVVIHLAGTVDPEKSSHEPNKLRDNNLRITGHVTALCRAKKTPLVYVSSTSVYTPSQATVDELSIELNPTSPYSLCKLDEERLIAEQLSESPFVIFRLGTIFGPSPGMRFQTAVNKFCWQAATGIAIEVWRTALHQRRPYLALSDCTRLLARSIVEGIWPRTVVNAVTCNVTVNEVLEAIETCGYPVEVMLVDSPIMNSLSFSVSSKLAIDLGFEFDGSLSEGISATMGMIGGRSMK